MTRPERTHEVYVGGLPLICHVRGRGPVCVVHPGGPGMHWEYARIPLAERELTMVYLEPAGTGRSARPKTVASYDLETYAEHLHAVVENLGGAPVFVLGHGHGGFVAQTYALRQPGPVAGLILYSTGPVANPRTAKTTHELLRRYAIQNSYADVLAAWDRPPAADQQEATRRVRAVFPAWFADYWGREAEFDPVRQALRCWPATDPDGFDLRPALSSISTPTLVLAGAHDVFFPPDQADALAAGITGARLAVFRQSGHLAHLEESERFAQLLLEFTRRIAGPLRHPRR